MGRHLPVLCTPFDGHGANRRRGPTGYFQAIAEAVDVPVMLQDASVYLGSALSPELREPAPNFGRLFDDLVDGHAAALEFAPVPAA